jgi:protein-tyrosine phosphatase
MTTTAKIGNGTLKIPLTGSKFYTVWGGPSSEAHKDAVFVKMAKELPYPCQIDIPTADFQVPNTILLDQGLQKAVQSMLAGKPLYVGCMAGRGRTGLFLAVLAKAFGIENPVEYVRKNYYSHAVETSGQYAFVSNYAIPQSVVTMIKYQRFWSWMLFFKKDLTKTLN